MYVAELIPTQSPEPLTLHWYLSISSLEKHCFRSCFMPPALLMNDMILGYRLQQQALQVARLHPAGTWREEETESSSDSGESSDDEGYINDADDISPAVPNTFLGVLIRRQQVFQASCPSNRLSINAAAPDRCNTAAENTSNGTPVNATDAHGPPFDNPHPPSPWGSSKTKQRIIDELKDEMSDIHLSIGHYTPTNFDAVNFKQILHKYAGDRYKPSLFRENIKRLLKHLLSKTGPFKAEEDVAEPWYTSVNNVSKAYALLYLLYMDKKKSTIINGMTAEQIRHSHPNFNYTSWKNSKNTTKT